MKIDILRPPFSLEQWLRDHGQSLSASDNLHSRLSAFSQAGFYSLVDAYVEPYEVVFLGLRKDESKHRLRNRTCNGVLCLGKGGARAGKWTCNPLSDWSGKDVLAYCLSRGAPLLPLYRCVSFMHRDEPWRIRKSWWIPGSSARHGGVAWLKRYYPCLYSRLCELLPDARQMI